MTSINMEPTSNNNYAKDRLSELPDELLVHILSFLPILDAVRTVLIRRFGNLWTLVSSLEVKDIELVNAENWPCSTTDYNEQIRRFTRFVFNVLILHKEIPINKFLLRFYDTDVCNFNQRSLIIDIGLWIRFAIERQVKELKVQFLFDVYDPILSRCVFTSEFLVILKLVHCEIKGLNRIQMLSLKKLSLTYVKVSNKMFDKVISGCPSLQELVLRYVYDLDVLQLTAPNIQKLYLDSYEVCVLDCPDLKILSIHLSRVSYHQEYLQIVDIPSVREVHIRSIYRFDDIVYNICEAEIVKFSEEAFQISNFKVLDIPQTRWKCLHIESQINEDQLIGICRVLRSSLHLEELIVYQDPWGNMQQEMDKTHEHDMLSEEPSSPCVIPQLKTVTMRGYEMPHQGLLRLAEFLLKSCDSLEKMVILPSTCNLVEELKFLKQLCSFPRASTNARIICGSEIY